jgi:hypothetical protein
MIDQRGARMTGQREKPKVATFLYALDAKERAKVQADTGISQETIRKFERGKLAHEGLCYALTRSFRKYGLPLPKARKTA